MTNMQEFLDGIPGMSKRTQVKVQLPPVNELLDFITENPGVDEIDTTGVTYDGGKFVIETRLP